MSVFRWIWWLSCSFSQHSQHRLWTDPVQHSTGLLEQHLPTGIHSFSPLADLTEMFLLILRYNEYKTLTHITAWGYTLNIRAEFHQTAVLQRSFLKGSTSILLFLSVSLFLSCFLPLYNSFSQFLPLSYSLLLCVLNRAGSHVHSTFHSRNLTQRSSNVDH